MPGIWGEIMKAILSGSFAVACAAGIACAAPASAVTTTLDFSGNICGAAGNQACGDYSEIGQNYGDGTGVDVSYRSTTSFGVTYEPYLKYWGTGYGDLAGIAWGGADASYASEITFQALPGYELTILGLDGACYANRATCQTFPFIIIEIGGQLPAALGAVHAPAGDHSSFAFNFGYSSSGYRLTWGPDGYDGGLDNIAFDVRAIAGPGGVPEPAAWALLMLGFGLVGGAMRGRSRKALAIG